MCLKTKLSVHLLLQNHVDCDIECGSNKPSI